MFVSVISLSTSCHFLAEFHRHIGEQKQDHSVCHIPNIQTAKLSNHVSALDLLFLVTVSYFVCSERNNRRDEEAENYDDKSVSVHPNKLLSRYDLLLIQSLYLALDSIDCKD